ncbi:MAG: hypothetical protein JST82_06275 [Bacteroidetes bacterium]|nr:hypothetical protein [Bacteroidota bacterium]
MNNRTVFYKLGMVMALAVAFQACKPKINEIDNNQVVSKPYVLYVADSAGAIYSTNDGNIYKFVFSSDNWPSRAVASSGNNLFFLKNNWHVIEYNISANSNPMGVVVNPLAHPATTVLDWPKFKRVYMAAALPSSVPAMIYQDSNGSIYKAWKAETSTAFTSTTLITSFTMLKNGRAFAYDDVNKALYWSEDPINTQWAGGATSLPTARKFFISHIANTLLAIADSADIYYSTDNGGTWNQYSGLPAGAKVISVCCPFDQTILVGLLNGGVYRLPLGTTTFIPASIGLAPGCTVTALSAKYDFFKNDAVRQYVYAATNAGLYRSNDNGENWVKVIGTEDHKGGFTALY